MGVRSISYHLGSMKGTEGVNKLVLYYSLPNVVYAGFKKALVAA